MTSEVADALVAAILPHLRNAVESNVRRWEAERVIELALGGNIDGVYEHYENLCIPCSTPEMAQKLITEAECRVFLESVLSAGTPTARPN